MCFVAVAGGYVLAVGARTAYRGVRVTCRVSGGTFLVDHHSCDAGDGAEEGRETHEGGVHTAVCDDSLAASIHRLYPPRADSLSATPCCGERQYRLEGHPAAAQHWSSDADKDPLSLVASWAKAVVPPHKASTYTARLALYRRFRLL
jgi:hypothetical protein